MNNSIVLNENIETCANAASVSGKGDYGTTYEQKKQKILSLFAPSKLTYEG